MMLLTRLPVELTVQPPATKRALAVSARPVWSVLFSTTRGSRATPELDELEAGELDTGGATDADVLVDVLVEVDAEVDADFEVDAGLDEVTGDEASVDAAAVVGADVAS
jgi:hypothetical protein